MDWEVRAASLVLFLGILLATTQNGFAERRIVCYYTNWSVYRPGTAKFSPQNINPYLCTHLIYAFGGFTKDNALKPFDKYQDIEKGGYAKFTGLKTYNKNLKTMLAIGGWNEGSSRFSPMVADPSRRREFVKNAVKFLRQNHFDGLDLDWEYPAFRDGGKPRDKDNYANLVQELREEFEREASKTGRTRLLLSMAMPAGIEYINKGYDVPRLNDDLDFINLLSYDYHSAYEPAVNHHSPLYPLEEDNEYNYDAELTIDYTISHLLEKGASADKIVLGIPTYGRSYTLFNQDATDLGSPADGPGVEGEATREKGYLAYYEICESVTTTDEWEVVQPNPNAMGPYAFKGDQWVGYDDEDIVKLKARYVNEKKLGGIMFWSIDNDDFRGKCHGRPYPLIEAAKEALLTDGRNTVDKTKSVDGRKKTRVQSTQSNAIARKLSGRRSSTTTIAPSTTRKRISTSSRTKYRTRLRTSEEEQEDRDVSRRSYDPSSDDDIEGGNTVRVTEKAERPKSRTRSKTRSGTADRASHRKQSRRKGQAKTDGNQESLSNKLTTPEPPTTPDPGTDFKCEDEGFFPHPRDCKKYFWCLDSGPGGLGVVAHQFTCPSGLVFNKAADSCDYPRNVICPKTKTSIVSTTRSPITAATSRTTYLHSTTTLKVEEEEVDDSEEDYEDEEEESEEEEEEEEEVKEKPRTTTTARALVYKTLTRSRPSSTTTTTTSKPNEAERIIDSVDEEDPKVIKELIDLIKKAGGIEQLEKQLLFQEKISDATSNNENVTPATISRTLYERVLNRQANKIGNQRPIFAPSETSYVNGPGRAQFEGLDDIPEVKSLRRSHKPQYVTIERPKSAKKEPSEDENVDEDEEDDNADEASFEEQSVSNSQRVTPSYVNIRRTRPSTTTSRNENYVGGKEEEIEEERPTRRRRPSAASKQQDSEPSSETSKPSRHRASIPKNSEKSDGPENQSAEKDDSTTTKSRYVSIQRFRSTTLKNTDDSASALPLSESTSNIVSSPAKAEEVSEALSTTSSVATTPSSTTSAPTTSTSTEVITVISVEPSDGPSSVSPTIATTSEPVKLVEDSATEILLTTVPASVSSQSASTTTTSTTTTLASRSTIAAVSQPRPFGFTRRRPGSLENIATTTPPSSQTRPKVADSETIRLPTLKELIGYPTTYDRTVTTALPQLPRLDVDNDISQQQSVAESAGHETNESSSSADFPPEGVKVYDQPSTRTIEEIGDSWLRHASESKAKSRNLKKKDVAHEKRKSMIANAVQEDENERRKFSTAIYLKPTTMRGIPLASLTPSPVTRGFYVTKGETDPSTWTESAVLDYSSSEQTEVTPTFETSTVYRVVTVADDQEESETSPVGDNAEGIVDGHVEEKVSTVAFSETTTSKDPGSAEDRSDHEKKSDVTDPSTGSVILKKGKSLRGDVDRGVTPLPGAHVISPTSPTRRVIAVAVRRYNELTTPLWTGRRIVRKRGRTTVSPIKDAIRQTESNFLRAPAIPSTSTLATTRKRIAAIPPILPIVSEVTTSEYLSDGLGNSVDKKIEHSRDSVAAEMTIATVDPTIATTTPITIISTTNNPVISTIANNPTTLTTAITDVIDDVQASTAVVASTSTIDTVITTFAPTASIGVKTTPAITSHTNTHEIATNSASTAATRLITSDENETTFTTFTADSSTPVIPTTVNTHPTISCLNTTTPAAASAIVNHSAVGKSTTVKMHPIIINFANMTTLLTTNTGFEITSTKANATTVAAAEFGDQDTSILGYSTVATSESTILSTLMTTADSANEDTGFEYLSVNTSETTLPTLETYQEASIASAEDEAASASLITNDYPVVVTPNALSVAVQSEVTTTSAVEETDAPKIANDTANYLATIPETENASTSEVIIDPMTELDITSTEVEQESVSSTVNYLTTSVNTHLGADITVSPIAEIIYSTAKERTADTGSRMPTSTTIAGTTVPATTDYSDALNVDENTSSTLTTAILNDTSAMIDASIETTPAIVPSEVVNTDSSSVTKSFETSSAASFPSLDVDDEAKVSVVVETTEVPATTETSSLFSLTTAIPSSPYEISDSTSATIAFSSENDGMPATLTVTEIPISTFHPVTERIVESTTTVERASKESTVLVATSRTLTSETTESSTYDLNFTGATSEKSVIIPEAKVNATEKTIPELPSSSRKKVQEPTDQFNATDKYYGQKNSGEGSVYNHIVNQRPIGRRRNYATRQPSRSHSRVTEHRGQERRPSYENTYSWSSRTANLRRRIVQKQRRLGIYSVNNTVNSSGEENDVDVRNTTEKRVYDHTENAGRRVMVMLKRVKEKIGDRETVLSSTEGTTASRPSSNSTKSATQQEERENGGRRRTLVRKRIKPQSKESSGSERIESESDSRGSPVSSFQSGSRMHENLAEEERTRRKMRVVLKRITPKAEEKNSTVESTSMNLDSDDGNLAGVSSVSNRTDKNISNERSAKRRTRVVLKSIKPKSNERGRTVRIAANSTDGSLPNDTSSNARTSENLLDEGKLTRRRTKVVLKDVRPKLEENNSTRKGADSDSTSESLLTDSSSNPYMDRNPSDEKYARRRRTKIVLKSVRPKSERAGGEEARRDDDSTHDDLEGNFSNKHYAMSIDFLPEEERMTRFKTEEEEEVNTEWSEDLGAEPRTTETSVRVEEDTDRPSNEVNPVKNVVSIGRKSSTGHSNRQRKPKTQATTVAPLINTVSGVSTTLRRSRPFAETTLSPRIDIAGGYEITQPYAKSYIVEDDQRAEVSDQSIHAQEFAVTLADPPASASSSSATGRALLKDDTAVRRKISTTIAPRTDSTTSGTVSRYGVNFRSRQTPRTKEKSAVSATTRPRKPPVIDYDYYDDDVPIIVGKSVLDSKLFLTSKGTIRCLDQGNFPHPYSCKKFITCARMVNGQVIGTEYTCPAKLSFDPVGGICNWSSGLGCKD